MQETDVKSLRAVLAAIAQVKAPLDTTVLAQLRQVAERLQADPKGAIAQLRLVVDGSVLQPGYEAARMALQQEVYRGQTRKEIDLGGQKPKLEGDELENLAVPLDQSSVAQEILLASDPGEQAREVQTKIEGQFAQAGQGLSGQSHWEWVLYLNR